MLVREKGVRLARFSQMVVEISELMHAYSDRVYERPVIALMLM